MKCPKCRTVNPETKKFCRECGALLSHVCPHCHAEILPADKFCGECGADGWVKKYEAELLQL